MENNLTDNPYIRISWKYFNCLYLDENGILEENNLYLFIYISCIRLDRAVCWTKSTLDLGGIWRRRETSLKSWM
jgi:hypothetical protein